MQKNLMALITLMRNRLNQNVSIDTKTLFFHEKGITLSIYDEDLYFLKSDPRGHITDVSMITHGIIFRGAEVACFHGNPIETCSLTKSKESFIWNDKTIFIEKLTGMVYYLYWDMKKKEWEVADDNKPNSSIKKLLISKVYNLLCLDPRYTYEVQLVETGENPGLYLLGMYDNKKCFELDWQGVDVFASRHSLKRPTIYAFEGFDKIEPKDLPLVAQDQTTTKVLINEI